LSKQISFKELKKLRPQVEDKTLPELLDIFESEGREDKLLLVYFIFSQLDLRYSFGMKFELFKGVIEQALRFRRKGNTGTKAQEKLHEIIRKNNPKYGKEIIRNLQEGQIIVPFASGMVDDMGNFKPQAISTKFIEAEAIDSARKNFSEEYNERFMLFIKTLYLIRTIRGILKKYTNDGYQKRLDKIVSSISGLGNIGGTLSGLEAMHPEVLKLSERYNGVSSDALTKAARAELEGFMSRLTKKYLSQIVGFQEIFRQGKINPQTTAYKTFEPNHLDMLFKAFIKRSGNKKYKEVKTFGDFVKIIFDEVLLLLKLKQGILTEDCYTAIATEMFGHFEVSADSFEHASRNEGQGQQQDIAYVSLLSKKGIVKFARFADGAQCCLSSNKDMELSQGYKEHMGAALNDQGLQAFLIHTKDKPIGFVLWHFGYDENKEMVAPSLKLYIAKEYQSSITTANVWRRIEKIMGWIGVKRIAQSQRSYGLAQDSPADYVHSSITISRIQTVKWKQETTVADLGDFAGQEGLHANTMMRAPMKMSVKEITPSANFAASGYQLPQEYKERVVRAVRDGKVIKEEDIYQYRDEIIKRLGKINKITRASPFVQFINETKVDLIVIRPKQQGLYKFGLNVDLSETSIDQPGRDVYATHEIMTNGSIRIVISEYTYANAGSQSAVIREMAAHELYEAYKELVRDGKWEADIDLELAIGQEIKNAKEWEEAIDRDEREDLGLLSDDEKSGHVRARALSRLIGDPSRYGKGTEYTDFLRAARARSLKIKDVASRFDKPLEEVVPMEKALQLMVEINQRKKCPLQTLKEILNQHDVLLWNYATFSPTVFISIINHLKVLIREGKVDVIALPLGEDKQEILDQYFRSGDETGGLNKTIIEKIYPSVLPESEKHYEIWLNLLKEIYQHNTRSHTRKVSVLVIASLESTPDQVESSIKKAMTRMPEGHKAVILKYFSMYTSWLGNDPRTYNLLHIDSDVGFTDNKINTLSYAINYLIGARRGDFILSVEESSFKEEEILPLSEEIWQRESIEAMKAIYDGELSSEVIDQIKDGFRAWKQQAGHFNYFKLYESVLVSLLGDDGEDRPDIIRPENPDNDQEDSGFDSEEEIVLVSSRSVKTQLNQGKGEFHSIERRPQLMPMVRAVVLKGLSLFDPICPLGTAIGIAALFAVSALSVLLMINPSNGPPLCMDLSLLLGLAFAGSLKPVNGNKYLLEAGSIKPEDRFLRVQFEHGDYRINFDVDPWISSRISADELSALLKRALALMDDQKQKHLLQSLHDKTIRLETSQDNTTESKKQLSERNGSIIRIDRDLLQLSNHNFKTALLAELMPNLLYKAFGCTPGKLTRTEDAVNWTFDILNRNVKEILKYTRALERIDSVRVSGYLKKLTQETLICRYGEGAIYALPLAFCWTDSHPMNKNNEETIKTPDHSFSLKIRLGAKSEQGRIDIVFVNDQTLVLRNNATGMKLAIQISYVDKPKDGNGSPEYGIIVTSPWNYDSNRRIYTIVSKNGTEVLNLFDLAKANKNNSKFRDLKEFLKSLGIDIHKSSTHPHCVIPVKTGIHGMDSRLCGNDNMRGNDREGRESRKHPATGPHEKLLSVPSFVISERPVIVSRLIDSLKCREKELITRWIIREIGAAFGLFTEDSVAVAAWIKREHPQIWGILVSIGQYLLRNKETINKQSSCGRIFHRVIAFAALDGFILSVGK
ncbi:MAG: hypothetical protein KAR31_04285, partial [Candidatus Omnitrophica bacterium]|nr:hypothetical protein [Candidatus Omnitrophota bacterium]